MSIGHMIINYARVGRWLGVGVTEDKLHSAPINTNQDDIRILDLGCGEGHWVFDMAKWVGKIGCLTGIWLILGTQSVSYRERQSFQRVRSRLPADVSFRYMEWILPKYSRSLSA